MTRSELIETMARALAYVEEKAGYPDHDANGVWLRLRESNRSYWRESATAALAALEARGLVLVSREATEAMAIACVSVTLAAMDKNKEPRPTEIWTAMIAASEGASGLSVTADQWLPIESAPVSPEALHLRKWVLFALRTRPYQSQKWCVGFCELDDDGARRYVNDTGHTIDFAMNKEEAIAWRPLPAPPATETPK